MSDVIERKETISWYKGLITFVGLINFFAFLTGIIYLTIVQRTMLGSSFLGWCFSINDIFFRGWILLLSDYTITLFCFICFPIIYSFYVFGKNFGIPVPKAETEKFAINNVLMVIFLGISVAFISDHMRSVFKDAKRDVDNIQWSAIACQTLPSKNCYCYTQTSEKTGEKVYSLIGALVYQNSDNVWLVDEKGLLHIFTAKHYELTRLSDEPFDREFIKE